MSSREAKLIKSLSRRRVRDERGLFIAEGLRFVGEIPKDVEIKLYGCTGDFLLKNPNFQFRECVKKIIFSNKEFESLSDTVSPQGILAVCEDEQHEMSSVLEKAAKGGGILLVLDGLKDPGNLGTIIRTADAMGVSGILMVGDCVDKYNPKVLRSTMGSIFRVPVIQNADFATIAEELANKKIRLLGASPHAETFCYQENICDKVAIVVGSEANGISREVLAACQGLVKAPMNGGAESLNAAVAAAIIIYESVRQRKC